MKKEKYSLLLQVRLKRSVKGLLPESVFSAPLTPGLSAVACSHDDGAQPKKKKPRLMDFCSIPKQPDHTLLNFRRTLTSLA